MAKQNHNYDTGLGSVDAECKEKTFLSEYADSLHSAMTQDKQQREVNEIESHGKKDKYQDQSFSPDIIDVSDESSSETLSTDSSSDCSSELKKVTVTVTTISRKFSNRKKIKKKKVTTIETQRRGDRSVMNKKDISLRVDDLNKKSTGAKKTSCLFCKGIQKCMEHDKNQRQVPENQKARDVRSKAKNDFKPVTKVVGSHLIEEKVDEEGSNLFESREKNRVEISKQSKCEIRTFDAEVSMNMSISDSSGTVTPDSIKIMEEKKKLSQFGIANCSDTTNPGSAKSQFFDDTGCRRKIEFKREEGEANCQEMKQTRREVSTDCQEIIVLSDSDEEDNLCCKGSLQNQLLRENTKNFNENVAKRGKIKQTCRKGDALFSFQEKTAQAIECNTHHEENAFNCAAEKRNSSATRARFAVQENGVCRDLIRSGYYDNIFVVKSASGQCFNSETSIDSKIKRKNYTFDGKQDQQESAKKREARKKKSHKRLHDNISTSDGPTSEGVKRACTAKKSGTDNQFNKEQTSGRNKLVNVERRIHDNRYYEENLSFNDKPDDDENQCHEETRTRHKKNGPEEKPLREQNSHVERRQRIKIRAELEQRSLEEKQVANENKTDNEHQFHQDNRSADEHRTANDNQCSQDNPFSDEKEIANENRFFQGNIISNKNRSPQKNQIANENRFPQENKIANENRFPQNNQFADKKQIDTKSLFFKENGFAHENRTADESHFLENNRSADEKRIVNEHKFAPENRFASKNRNAEESRFLQESRYAGVNDSSNFSTSEPMKPIKEEKKYSEFGVINVSVSDNGDFVKSQLFGVNSNTEGCHKMEIDDQGVEDGIEDIEGIIVMSDSDADDNLWYKRSLQNELFEENRQNFTEISVDRKEVTVAHNKDDAQLSPCEKTEEKFSKAKLSGESNNNMEKRDFNEHAEKDVEQRNDNVARPRFVVQKNGNCLDLVRTGRRWWNKWLSKPIVDHKIKKEKQFANAERAPLPDKRKSLNKKRARMDEKSRDKDHCYEEEKAHDEQNVDEKYRLKNEFCKGKGYRQETQTNEGKISRDKERIDLERSFHDKRDFDENQFSVDKQADQKDRCDEETRERDERILRELERIHYGTESHDEESVRENNRACEEKSLSDKKRSAGDKRSDNETQLWEGNPFSEKGQSDKTIIVFEDNRFLNDRQSPEQKHTDKETPFFREKRDFTERRISEEKQPANVRRYSKEQEPVKKRQSSERRPSSEERRFAEEQRSAKRRRFSEENQYVEEKRPFKEKRSAQDKKSAEEKPSMDERRSAEKKRFAEEKLNAEGSCSSDEGDFRGFDFYRDENRTSDTRREHDQTRFQEKKQSDNVDGHKVLPNDCKNGENEETRTKSHKLDNRQQNPSKPRGNNGAPNRAKILKEPRLKPNCDPIVLIRKLGRIKKSVPIVKPTRLPKSDRRASCSNVIHLNKSIVKQEVNTATPSTSQSSQFTASASPIERKDGTENQSKSVLKLSKRDLVRQAKQERKIYMMDQQWRRINCPSTRSLPISTQTQLHLTSEERENIKAIRRKQLREIAEQQKNPASEKSVTIPAAVSEAGDESSAKRIAIQSAKVTEESRGYFLLSKSFEQRAKKKLGKFERLSAGKKSERKMNSTLPNADDKVIDNSDESENWDKDQNSDAENSNDMEIVVNVATEATIGQKETRKLKGRKCLVSEMPKSLEFLKTQKHVSFDDDATEIHEFEIESGHKMRKFDPKDCARWQRLPIKNNDKTEKPASDNTTDNKIYPKMEEFLAHIFQWNPRWLEEQIEIKAPPPIVDEKKLTAMLSYYRTYEEYYKIAEPLLTLEMWYGISKDFEVGNPHVNFFSIVSNSINVLPIYFTNVEVSTLILEVVVSERDLQAQAHPVYGDLLFFEYYSNRKDERGYASWEVFAYVTSLRKTLITSLTNLNCDLINAVKEPHTLLTYTVMTKALDHTDVQTNRVNRLRTISYLRSNMRMVQALQTLPESPLMNIILHPKIEDYQLPAVKNVEAYDLVTKDSLNTKQLEAVVKITNAVVQKLPKVCLIQGPPGTGKSKVIVNLVTQILYGDDRYNSDKKLRILVCAPSNAAVDEIVLRLLDVQKSFEKEKRFNIVRTGRTETMHPSVTIVSLRELARKRVNQKCDSCPSTSISDHQDKCERWEPRNFAKMYREAEEDLLKGADVIASTLTSCYTNQMELIFRGTAESISVCIVDEATQSAEPENLIPLMLGVRTLVLVGDTNQLPATILSQKAKQFGLDQSLFARIWRVFSGEANNPIIQLDTQYRMTIPVAHFPNKYFYSGALTNAAKMHKLPFHFYRVINLDSTQDSNKFSNVHEADFVANLVYAMIARTNYDNAVLPVRVGIITPYNSQKNLLRQRISERICRLKDKDNIVYEVNTVDSFQGQERDVIIMSCVRSSGIGFLSDRQRLCVALTRAKHSLILCGNFRTFHRDPMWKALLSDAQTRNVYLNVKSNANPGDIRSHIIR